MDVQRRFLAGLAGEAGVDPETLGRPGTLVVGREQRIDSGIVVCYWAGHKALVWGDPKLVAKLDDLADEDRTLDVETATSRIVELGSPLVASADMRVLEADSTGVEAGPIPDGYRQRWLRTDDPAHVDLVRAFADRSDPDDVEEAALDDMDNFDEQAINVLVPDGPDTPEDTDGDLLVAYASAAEWDWDDGFSDIGVLIDPGHRGKGLGTLVVAHTVAALKAAGRLPLYRHGHHNEGSKRIAEANGFTRATTLYFFSPPE